MFDTLSPWKLAQRVFIAALAVKGAMVAGDLILAFPGAVYRAVKKNVNENEDKAAA